MQSMSVSGSHLHALMRRRPVSLDQPTTPASVIDWLNTKLFELRKVVLHGLKHSAWVPLPTRALAQDSQRFLGALRLSAVSRKSLVREIGIIGKRPGRFH